MCSCNGTSPSMPRNVVAIGKCAGALLDGVAAVHAIDAAFVAIPEGYPLPRTNAEVHAGGHPQMTPASFAAGRALLAFVEKHDDILFLISGGGSACVEVALAPYGEEEVAQANARLVASGRTIAEINHKRRKLSAIKGGRLRERVRGRCVTLVYSDVSTGALADIASGPTITDSSEAQLIADNTTLTATAAQMIGDKAVLLETQIDAARGGGAPPAMRSRALSPPDPGRGGDRRSWSAGRKRRTLQRAGRAIRGADAGANRRSLFASSDGVDGNSGAAGIYSRYRRSVETTLGRGAGRLRFYRIAAQSVSRL